MSTILSRLDGDSLRRHYASGHWTGETIYAAAARHAGLRPDGIAVREASGTLLRGDLMVAVDALAATLHHHGLRKGDRVAVWLPSRAETAVALLACSRNGYVVCPSLHRDHTVADVAELVGRMRAAAVLVQEGYGTNAGEADLVKRISALPSVRWIGTLPPRAEPTATSSSDLLHDLRALLTANGDTAQGTAQGTEPPAVHTDPDAVSYLAFTSGTTGEPKGVMHTDNTITAATRAMMADWGLDATSVIYSLSPLSHNLGFGAMVLALTGGGELVIHDLQRGASLARRLAETGATFALGVPTHAVDLLTELEQPGAPELPDLRGFRISGAAIAPRVARALIDLGIVPQSGYGMTEGGSHHYTRPDDDAERIVETSGRPFAGHHARIVAVDDPERELPPGEVGQITSAGPSVTVGYFGDQERTEESFNRSGWLLTGDLGWADENGYIRITGRKKELIIRGGHNIHPARIERLATAHPAIEQAAAIPVPDERLGERVGLVIRLAAGATLEDAALLQHLADQGLSRYDMPEHLAYVAAMPLTASGKIAKRELIDRAAAGSLPLHAVRFTIPSSA